MKRTRLLLLLALLMTAATGAWAQTSDKETPLTLQATAEGWIYISNPKVGMKYKVGNDEKQTITSTSYVSIHVTEGQTVQFFGNGTEITAYGVEQSGGTKITCDVKCYIYGNIMSLVDETGFATATELTADYAFKSLFASNFSNLSNHASRKLVLPAMTLTKDCYYGLFMSTGLTEAPALPAQNLAERCYENMFDHCTSLTAAPELPATTLKKECYYGMFQYCTSLTTAPLLPAPTLAQQCYNWMFWGCTNLNDVTCLATDISAQSATYGWLSEVAATGTLTIAKGMEDTWAARPTAEGIPSGWTTDVYGYKVKLADGTADAGNWTATVGTSTTAKPLPVGGLSKGDAVTLTYGGRLKVKSVTATHDGWNGDLSNIPASAIQADGQTLIVDNGMTLKGTLDVSTIPYKVVIPADATVTLAGVTILGTSVDDDAHRHAGITCLGDATIILADGSDNKVKGFYNSFPGIQPGPAGTTLTITGGEQGTGKLTASSNGWGAGIGAGHHNDITECGNILITGGNITAIGSNNAAAIGSGDGTKCGNITITNGVTKVTAEKVLSATYRIGPGDNGGSCGTIIIGCTLDTNGNPEGGTKYWENNAAVDNAADNYLRQATIIYPEP